MKFKELHEQNTPLIVCNVWDVNSAKTAEKLGFKAIGTSSAAIASLLGYEDGENISFNELIYFVKRITANTSLPLTVDLESGYSDNPAEIVCHIKSLIELGVVGVNIEDSIVDGERILHDSNYFARILSSVAKQLKKEKLCIFLNIRTDAFLIGSSNTLVETKNRIQLYAEAGANGIFIPCINKESDIKSVVDTTSLPINVMCMPSLPSFTSLQNLGVKRISMGDFLFDKMTSNLEDTLRDIVNINSFGPIF